MSEELLDPALLVGRAITGVFGERWFRDRIEGGPGIEPPGSDTTYASSDLVYWQLDSILVEVEGLGWVSFYGRALVQAAPEPGWFVFPGDVSRASSIDAPAPLAALVGATITAVTPLYNSFFLRRLWRRKLRAGKYSMCGHIFETTKGSVAIALVDPRGAYAVGEWPGNKKRWEALDVVSEVDPRRVPATRGGVPQVRFESYDERR